MADLAAGSPAARRPAADLLAIPAGFEPATHGVEIRSDLNNINRLAPRCSNGVAFRPRAGGIPPLQRPAGRLQRWRTGGRRYRSHFDRRVSHERRYLFWVVALLDPQGRAGVP